MNELEARVKELERTVQLQQALIRKLGDAAMLQQTVLQALCVASGVRLEVGSTKPATKN
jgi:uncharacterized coiled-coil protein SlyX